MHLRPCRYTITGVVIVGAALTPVLPTPPTQPLRSYDINLASSDTANSPLGDGTALIVGPSGVPFPTPTYVDSADQLYLQPHGFSGTLQPLFTPEGLSPATGVESLPITISASEGAELLDSAILKQIAAGGGER